MYSGMGMRLVMCIKRYVMLCYENHHLTLITEVQN